MKDARNASGLSVHTAAKAVGRSDATLWRMEGGQGPSRPPEIRALCEAYGTSAELTSQLMELATRTREMPNNWWQSQSDVIPTWFNVFLSLEDAATEFRRYESELVPGLFQTEDYARAIISALNPHLNRAEIDQRVAVRRARQSLVTREIDRPTFRVVLNEAVLRRLAGGPHVLAAQCMRLAELSEQPHIDLRVLPFSVGAHAGVRGPFVIFRFSAEEGRLAHPPTVYVEGYTGALYLDEETDVAPYDDAFDRMMSAADDPQGNKSREILWKAAREATT